MTNKKKTNQKIDFLFDENSHNAEALYRQLKESDAEKDEFVKIYKANKSLADISTFDRPNLNALWTEINSRKRKRRMQLFYRYASIVVIVLTIAGVINFTKKEDIITPVAQETIVESFANSKTYTLIDGTQIFMKPNTRIVIADDFSKSNRNITFSRGEAFLEVTHNPSAPFVIKNKEYKIRVLGTKFNVRSRADEDIITTCLKEGKVEVSYSDKKLAVLKPNEKLVFDKEQKQYRVRRFVGDGFFSWKDNLVSFKGKTIEEIIGNLGIVFNKEVQFKAEFISNSRFSGEFKDKSLEYILNVLTELEKFTYMITDHEIIIDDIRM